MPLLPTSVFVTTLGHPRESWHDVTGGSASSGWTLSTAQGINDSGEVVGQGELGGMARPYLARQVANARIALHLGSRRRRDGRPIVLTGIVRPYDIDSGNVVSSRSVGQMQIRYYGQGLMKDNLKPGWIVRMLNKVF